MIDENILYGYDYDVVNNTLIGRPDIKDYGFFSTFTLMLTSLMVVYKKYKKTPSKIDGNNLLRKLKNDSDTDMYHHFFHIDEELDINFDDIEIPVPFSPDDQHTIYSEKYSKYYNVFFKKYFNVNQNIQDKIDELTKKYDVDLDNSISVIYRDSDKWTDMGGFNYISAGGYFRKCKEIFENDGNRPKVLIQSENTGVISTFHQAFGSTFFTETSLGNSSEIYPPIPLDDNKKIEWSEYYIASLWVHSKCKYVITYTGNSGFFIYLNRGTTKNLTQEITFTKNYNEFFVTNN
jgi:hypothetical protein